ncbi:hypothetical protein QDA03_gp82 [Microbacterium phage Terij]|uniref:Uncharacterized protein n=1 Tax=Microbacterium phage Terij TaxID=2686229 RepID=A0A6B9LIT0_9CAUD|nr:hypothetical protein QDA03_gp82 [Microbacterium phage Terij]QHB37159.1 hypothetical protein SEA_TERIJ_25 [Microbacterium phage Terij]
MHNDGTGPQYDRPRRPRPVTRHEVRRPEPAEPTDFERYQALLADGIPDADARTAIWPDNALVYGTGEDGNSVLLPVGEDGMTIVPEGFAEGDLYPPAEPTGADGDDTEEDGETETPAADAEEHAEEPQSTEDAPTATETENGAESAAEPADETTEDDTETDEAPVVIPDAGYEPADHNRNEVQKYLAENPDQAEYVLARERTGKARVSLIGA